MARRGRRGQLSRSERCGKAGRLQHASRIRAWLLQDNRSAGTPISLRFSMMCGNMRRLHADTTPVVAINGHELKVGHYGGHEKHGGHEKQCFSFGRVAVVRETHR